MNTVVVVIFALVGAAWTADKPEMCDKFPRHVICLMYGEIGGLVGNMQNNMVAQEVLKEHMRNKSRQAYDQIKDKVNENDEMVQEWLKDDPDLSCGENGTMYKHLEKAKQIAEELRDEPRCPKGCTCTEFCVTCGDHEVCEDEEPKFLEEPNFVCFGDVVTLPLMGCGRDLRQCGAGCPNGFSCFKLQHADNRSNSDVMGCCPTKVASIPAAVDVGTDLAKRCGGEAEAKFADGTSIKNCSLGEQCPAAFQCTLAADTDGICCPDAKINGNGNPEITTLLVGSLGAAGIDAASYYVKTDNFSAIVDMGWPSQVGDLAKGLQDAGVRLCDLDMVIATHPHPDHTGAAALFSRTPFLNSCGNLVQRDYYWPTGLADTSARMILSQNVEVRQTPGHTTDGCSDKSVFVYNVKDVGTAVISGDLILNEEDALKTTNDHLSADWQAVWAASRQMIVCAADVIYPGHGKSFTVTDKMIEAHGC